MKPKTTSLLATTLIALTLMTSPISQAKNTVSTGNTQQEIFAKKTNSEIRKLWVQRNIQKKLLKSLQKEVAEFKKLNQKLHSDLKQNNLELEKIRQDQLNLRQEISQAISSNTKTIKETDQKAIEAIELSKKNLAANSSLRDEIAILKENSTNDKILMGLVALVVFLSSGVISLVSYLKSRNEVKKATSKISLLEESTFSNQKLIEESFAKENSCINSLITKIDNLLEKGIPEKEIAETKHDLIKAIADRITFMQMTLFRMDKETRGYKQLNRSIRQMHDNLLAHGYEIVDMLGQPYNEGIKAIPSFVEDPSLPEGAQIITGVRKPQINFEGQMIQAAQITVSQNS